MSEGIASSSAPGAVELECPEVPRSESGVPDAAPRPAGAPTSESQAQTPPATPTVPAIAPPTPPLQGPLPPRGPAHGAGTPVVSMVGSEMGDTIPPVRGLRQGAASSLDDRSSHKHRRTGLA
jgi:hypothetical protein